MLGQHGNKIFILIDAAHSVHFISKKKKKLAWFYSSKNVTAMSFWIEIYMKIPFCESFFDGLIIIHMGLFELVTGVLHQAHRWYPN